MNVTVLLDTNVFTAPLRNDRSLAAQYTKHVFGRRIAVSPQTLAEASYGALHSGWGTRRLNELARLTGGVRVLPVDDETIERVAQLRNECRVIGHALHQRHHNGGSVDRRGRDPVERSAGRPRCVFASCPGLDLRTELAG